MEPIRPLDLLAYGETEQRRRIVGRGGRICEVEGCGQETSGAKPYCCDHVDRMPYVQRLRQAIEAGALGPDPDLDEDDCNKLPNPRTRDRILALLANTRNLTAAEIAWRIGRERGPTIEALRRLQANHMVVSRRSGKNLLWMLASQVKPTRN